MMLTSRAQVKAFDRKVENILQGILSCGVFFLVGLVLLVAAPAVGVIFLLLLGAMMVAVPVRGLARYVFKIKRKSGKLTLDQKRALMIRERKARRLERKLAK